MSKALATKNVAAIALGIGLIFALSFAFATPARAQSIADLQAQIQTLLAAIAALQGGGSTSAPAGAGCYTFTRNHQQSDSGGEVMWIQQFLNSHGSQVSASGAGSPGNETSFFGARTRAAVSAFQTANGISPTAGYWGPLTRAKANAICAAAAPAPAPAPSPVPPGTPVPVPISGSLNVMAGAQPANTLAPQSAIRVPFTTFTLTNNTSAAVAVNGITVQRGGLANDAVFAGIVLVDSNGLQVGIAKTLNSNHQAVVGDAFTIQPGQSANLTIAGNMNSSLSSYTGQVASLSIVGVNTSVPVSGALPITGASQTINSSLVIGNVTTAISSFDPQATASKNIGDTGIKFAGIRFTAGSAEDLKLYSIRWRQAGSVGSGDLANVVTVVDGTSYPTVVSADGKFFTTTFPGGLLIQKGNSIDAYSQGDIVGSNSSSRTAEFDIDKTSDVYLVGQLYSYGVAPAAGTGSVDTDGTNNDTTITSGTPWFQGSTISITGASVTTLAKATEVPAQNVAVNVANQPLGGYIVDLKGESISVASQVFHFATSSLLGSGFLTNVTIVDQNGAVVAGPVDAVRDTDSAQKVTFTDTVTYKTGRAVYTLKGKLPTGLVNGGTIVASFTGSTDWTSSTGQVTGNTFTWPAGQVSLNTMTVRAAQLVINMSSQPSAQNIVAGGQGIVFANIQLDAGQSGENVRLSSLPIHLVVAGGGAVAHLTSCQLFPKNADGSYGAALNTGSNVPTTLTASATANANTFTLDNSLTVMKGTLTILGLKCNSTTAASGTFVWNLYSADTFTVTGVTSGGSLTTTLTIAGTQAGTGTTQSAASIMTIASGSLAISTDSSSPSYAVVAAGTSGVTIGTYKFRPANEAVWLNKLGVSLTNAASSSASDLNTVYIYQGSTLLGTATFTGTNTTATSTFASPVLLAKDADTIITIKSDLAQQGTSQSGTAGHLVAIDHNSADATGQSSGLNIQGTGSTAVGGVRVFKSYPIFTYSAAGGTAINGVNDLLVLNVQAPAAGPVKLNKLTFNIATTTATLTVPTFAGPNGNVASTTNVNINPLGSTITIFFDSTTNTSDQEIGAGQTKTYTLRATLALTGTNVTGSVSTALAADTAYPSLSGFMSAATTLTGSRTVWSPMTTTSPVAAVSDWTNGYGLGGCFTSSGIGNDCTARVLSK